MTGEKDEKKRPFKGYNWRKLNCGVRQVIVVTVEEKEGLRCKVDKKQ